MRCETIYTKYEVLRGCTVEPTLESETVKKDPEPSDHMAPEYIIYQCWTSITAAN